MPDPSSDSRASWVRLAICMALSTVGGVGMWAVVVVLPSIQAQFHVDRGQASLPYTAVMLGFALGSALMGRVTDRFGIRLPMLAAGVALAAGFVLAGFAGSLWMFSLVHFALIALLGASVTFGPMMAHVSLWFERRRGIAVSLCASGNYIAGAIWPPVLEHFVAAYGWRDTYVGIGLFCGATMLPLALLLRGHPPAIVATTGPTDAHAASLGLSPAVLQAVLIVAGLACCVAMATPQVHLVAYCGDLGYGAEQGASMLSLMLGLGIISRIASGWLADRIGGLRTLLIGSTLQGVTLLLYSRFDGLTSLYLISAMFGLVQGGIIPSYTIVVRECFSAREAGARVGLVLMATMCGMALGGWAAGAIDDWTGSYRLAFANGALWNVLNIAIVLTLLLRRREFLALAARLAGPPLGR